MAKELYVGHISEQATEEDLRKLFSLMGPVTSVHLIVDQQTGEFKRCAYVRMLSEVNLNEVVETLDGTYLIDRCIVVSIAKPQKERTPSTTVRRKPQGAARPAAAGNDGGKAHPAGAKGPARSGRPAASDSAKTGRPSAARESVRPARPTTGRDDARSERTAPAGRTPKSGRPAGGKRSGDTPRPPSKGRR